MTERAIMAARPCSSRHGRIWNPLYGQNGSFRVSTTGGKARRGNTPIKNRGRCLFLKQVVQKHGLRIVQHADFVQDALTKVVFLCRIVMYSLIRAPIFLSKEITHYEEDSFSCFGCYHGSVLLCSPVCNRLGRRRNRPQRTHLHLERGRYRSDHAYQNVL